MSEPTSSLSGSGPARQSLFRNWLSLTGLLVVAGSLFSFLLLFLLDAFAGGSNPYIGVLTYFIVPLFLTLGLVVMLLGLWRRRRQIIKAGATPPPLQIDLSRLRDRRVMGMFVGGAVVFLLVSAMGSYHTYHFTESVTFCGKTCHTVMNPELTSYTNGPHARVTCTECHIGSGATWFVRSKLSGTYQVYATLADKYPRPIPTPIHNLRPAQETCEQCHWPRKFVGNLERTFSYYLNDYSNSQFAVRLLMKVGGADPTHGPVDGIHWHMNVANKIQYVAAKRETNGLWVADSSRQKIPWVRMIDPLQVVREFRLARFTNDPSHFEIRTMDCMDCHNRPAHVFKAPNTALNLALGLKQMDPTLPLVKSNALWALTQAYTNEDQALQNIATTLARRYPDNPRIRPVIEAVQRIYRENFFPEMNVSWKVYTDNIGHMYWPGCFRCHDGLHKTVDGKQSIKASDCRACHVIMAQGTGDELKKLSADGLKFAHPGDELDANPQCHECHNGGL